MTKKKIAPAKQAPAPGIRFLESDESHAELARQWKQYIREAADRIENGLPLESPQLIAKVLRKAADDLPERAPRPRGHPPEIDPGGLALVFAFMVVHKKMGVNEAHAALAEQG